MGRRIKFITPQMGDLHLYAIWEKGGSWEDPWEILRETRIGDQFSRVSQDALDHALNKYHRPLVDQLGIPPKGALRKLGSTECLLRHSCTFYEPSSCQTQAKHLSHCFELDGIEDPAIRQIAYQAIEYWRSSIYVVVVTHG